MTDVRADHTAARPTGLRPGTAMAVIGDSCVVAGGVLAAVTSRWTWPTGVSLPIGVTLAHLRSGR